MKDQLGIKHRRELKASAKSDLEQAPMFHRPHFRSESEISNFQPDALQGSPPALRSYSTPNFSEPPSPSPNAGFREQDDLVTPVARTQMTPSLYRGSYYSASNIPVSSPTPSPIDPPMSSVSSQPVSSSTPPNTLQIPALRGHPPNPSPEVYEMHVRSTQDELQTPTARTASESHDRTFVPYDVPFEEVYVGTVPADRNLSAGHHPPEESWRNSTYSTYSSTSGPTVL